MKKLVYLYVLMVLLITSAYVYIVIKDSFRGKYLEMSFINVGQGDSIYIRTPSGNDVLIDGGKDPNVLRELSKIMPFYDKEIDLVVASHPDLDHIGGLLDVVNRFNVVNYAKYASSSDTELSESIEDVLREKKGRVVGLEAGDRLVIDLEHDIYIDVLSPEVGRSYSDRNDNSIVMKLVYGETSFLFTGDASVDVERYLVGRVGKMLDVDLLKVGHHGSKTSTSEELLGFSSPDFAIISSGKENKFGHPHQEVLDRLEKFDIKIFNTKDLTTIAVRSDGEVVEVLD